MILVLLGTQANDFSRLLKEIEKQIDNGTIKEEVIVQAGSTKYESQKMKQFDLLPKEQIEELKETASFIITHGGVGSILSSIKLGKKVIAVPRLQEYGEHVNNHQIQIIENFEKQGYIIGVENLENLQNAIKEIDKFEPKEYKSNTKNMINIIEQYIEKMG